jgi:Holliday junction resolvase-like predicted endonuclease
MAEMGEYVVGAYLKHIKGCQHVWYNVRAGKQGEIDVVGLDLRRRIVYICEVETHIKGLLVSKKGLGDVTAETIQEQLKSAIIYGKQWSRVLTPKYMFWSPKVPKGRRTAQLQQIRRTLESDVEIVINSEYKKRVRGLQEMARHDDSTSGEPFYRALQILEHLRD